MAEDVWSVEKFKYDQLDTSKRQIRLLKVDQTPSHEHPHVNIEPFDLDEAPIFHALSYTWGSSSPAHHILLNGGRWQVSENLYHFLQWLQHRPKATSYYWIDQLCINQNTGAERDHQVSMMSDIYPAARKVVIWLGPAGASSPLLQYYLDHRHHDQPFSMTSTRLLGPDDSRSESLQILQDNSKVFREFFANPYWDRLWIVQEVLLAQKISIACHGGHFPWRYFQKEGLRQTIENMYHRTRLAWLLRESRDPRRGYVAHGLMYLLSECRLAKCAEVQDKIFGLQGLLKPEQRIEVDYRLSIDKLYLKTVKIILRDRGHEGGKAVDTCVDLGKTMMPSRYTALSTCCRYSDFKEVVALEEGEVAGWRRRHTPPPPPPGWEEIYRQGEAGIGNMLRGRRQPYNAYRW